MYPRGHIPDHPAVVAARAGIHLHPKYAAIRATPLPLASTNRPTLLPSAGGPGILNQNDTGSCEGHAHASGVTLRLALAGTPLPEVVSPVGLYLGALLVDRTPNADGTLPPLTDTGTMPSSILTAMGLWGSTGASVWGQYPASSTTMYVTPSDLYSPLIEPTPEKLYAESSFRLGGAYFVQTSGLQKVLDILSMLASGRPVSDAIPASCRAFQCYTGGILTAAQMTGDVDHANLIVDYAWTGTQEQFTAWQGGATGLDQYLVGYGVNSWGSSWGESDASGLTGGMYRFDRSFFDQLQDPCVLDVSRAS